MFVVLLVQVETTRLVLWRAAVLIVRCRELEHPSKDLC